MRDFFKMVLASCLGVVLASLLVMIIFFSMVASTVSGIMKSFKGDTEHKELRLSEESVFLLDVEGVISDLPSESIYSELTNAFNNEESKSYTLQQVLRAISVARENPKVDAMVLRLDKAMVGYAAAGEIRAALESFKESGKPIYSYSNTYGYGNYYISSVADYLYGSPMGSLYIQGLASTTTFNKGLMDKLGVELDIFRVGTYKGAVESFMLDKLSDENRHQIQVYLDGLWQGTTSEIAKSRNISTDVIQNFADEGLFMSFNEVGVAHGLLDSLVYESDIDEVLAEKISGDRDDDLKYLSVSDMLRMEKRSTSSDKIAVIYAEGDIISALAGDELPIFSDEKYISVELVDKLREARDDDSIDAVVLRVNSPGGSLDTSELIAREVEKVKEKKPIVVSMGNMAASGGYYISSHASTIVASPYTITGSIGIFGIIPNFAGTMQKLGLKSDVVKTADLADFPSGIKSMTQMEKEVMQNMINDGYDLFLSRVATGRGMSVEQVNEIGQGRVWLGAKANELNLVDKLGGLDVAIDEAARLANIEGDYRVVEMVEKKDIWGELLGLNIKNTFAYLTMSFEDRMMLQGIEYFKQLRGIQLLPPFSIEVTMDDAEPMSSPLAL